MWLIVLILSTTGCTSRKDKLDLNNGVRVQIPVYENGDYKLDIVEIKTLNSLKKVEGQAASFYLNPNLKSSNSSVLLTGFKPTAQYIIDKDGVVIPSDDMSIQTFSLYAAFEKLMNFDSDIGLKGLLLWPRNIIINYQFLTGDENFENNALYSSQIDSYVFLKYTAQDLPMMVNSGIVSHEHFHAIFNKLVGSKNIQKINALQTGDEALYHQVLIRGVNEGLADVWGYLVTSDANFVARSLTSIGDQRKLDIKTEIDLTTKKLKEKLALYSEEDAVPLAYELGAVIARKYYEKAIKKNDNKDVAKELIENLKTLSESIAGLKKDSDLEIEKVLEIFGL
jgi:hypothetical protein